MSQSRFPYVGAVFVLLINENNQILFIQRGNTGRRDGRWSVPAGHMEGEETPRQAGRRELHEELGINIEIDDLEFAGVEYMKSNDERINFCFVCHRRSGEPINAEPEKHTKIKRFPIDQLPSPIDYISDFIQENYLQKKYYKESKITL